MLSSAFSSSSPDGGEARIYFFILLLFVVLVSACASQSEQDGLPAGQVFGDTAKCTLPQNHALPGCFCHEMALARFPERRNSCKPTVRASADQIDDYQIGNCENPLVALNSLASLREKKETFCSLDRNQNLSSCYCYPGVVDHHPERQAFCANVTTGALPKDLQYVEPRTLAWLEQMRQRTRPLDHLVDESQENWADNTEAYLYYQNIEDDCDAVDSLLDIAFAVGGFELFELAKILVDTNSEDDTVADHYVAAVWADGQWFYLETANFDVLPLYVLEYGDVFSQKKDRRTAAELVAYRRLDQSEWYKGRPPGLSSAVASFCPVPGEVLLPSLFN